MSRNCINLGLRFFAALVFIASSAQGATRSGELVLVPELTRELNALMKTVDALHRSLVSQNEELVEIGLRDLLWQINRVRTFSHLAKPHERGHLVRIIEAAREHFELTQTSYGEERRARLEDGFNQLVNLVRIYRLDRAYGIFFCPKDRTTWVQKGARALNPFRPETNREPCGIKVPN